jgi:hypothetical protein
VEEATRNYQTIQDNIYKGANTGNSPVDDCLPCQCKFNPRKSMGVIYWRCRRIENEGKRNNSLTRCRLRFCIIGFRC